MLAPFAQDGGSDCFLVANRYTLIDHSALDQFLPLCLVRRISVVLGGPYYMGILATDLTPQAVVDLFQQQRPGDAEILRQARRIGAVCANHGVPLKAAALQFGLGHPAVAATLIGTSTPQQVEENVQMACVPVPAALWAELKTEGLIPPTGAYSAKWRITMPHRLDNKVAIITGGTSGIGKATVELFAKEGARVVFMARGAEETGRGLPGGRAVEAAIRAAGGEVTFIACDIGNAEMVEAAVAEAAKTYGPINILFNNAGGGGSGSFPDSTNEEWTRVIDPDLTGMFYVSRAVWPHIVAAGGGAVVNMSSLAAQQFFTPRRHEELPGCLTFLLRSEIGYRWAHPATWRGSAAGTTSESTLCAPAS